MGLTSKNFRQLNNLVKNKVFLNALILNVEATIKSSNLKAIFITNVLGLSGDIDNIKDMCNAKNIILFEDNCESLGSTLPSAKLGNFGLMSSFSFFVAHSRLLYDRVRLDESFPMGPCSTSGDENSLRYGLGP